MKVGESVGQYKFISLQDIISGCRKSFLLPPAKNFRGLAQEENFKFNRLIQFVLGELFSSGIVAKIPSLN